jgi:protein-tyrosine phosphatase
MQRVMFVCLGNICRSPLGEGAFAAHVADRGLQAEFAVASAGTGNYHVGERPDRRSVAVAARYDVDIGAQRGRHLVAQDLEVYDHVLCMDRANLKDAEALLSRVPPDRRRARLSLLLDELPEYAGLGADVPDPYYGGLDGFDRVWAMVDAATLALLDRLCAERDRLNDGG